MESSQQGRRQKIAQRVPWLPFGKNGQVAQFDLYNHVINFPIYVKIV